jgi:type I pantothenate kinase
MTSARTSSHDDVPAASPEIGSETFSRTQWAALGDRPGSARSLPEARQLAATGDPIETDEIVDIYLPLARFIEVLAEARWREHQHVRAFLGEDHFLPPFIVGIAGGVAVGKSTTARVLQALLRDGDGRPGVDLLTTDGFLYPNATLESRGLMERKGFPESYDQRKLIGVLAAIRAGDHEVAAPVYSHLAYDILPREFQYLRRPSLLIVEGLNVLQVNTKGASPEHVVVSDFFDFSIYVDAAEDDVARWFAERLLALRATVLQESGSFFHRFALLPEDEVLDIAHHIWSEINLVNLRENIAPTRGRARLVLEKGSDHRVHRVILRDA